MSIGVNPYKVREAVTLLKPAMDASVLTNVAWLTVRKFVDSIPRFTQSMQISSAINIGCIVGAIVTVFMTGNCYLELANKSEAETKKIHKKINILFSLACVALMGIFVNSTVTLLYARYSLTSIR